MNPFADVIGPRVEQRPCLSETGVNMRRCSSGERFENADSAWILCESGTRYKPELLPQSKFPSQSRWRSRALPGYATPKAKEHDKIQRHDRQMPRPPRCARRPLPASLRYAGRGVSGQGSHINRSARGRRLRTALARLRTPKRCPDPDRFHGAARALADTRHDSGPACSSGASGPHRRSPPQP